MRFEGVLIRHELLRFLQSQTRGHDIYIVSEKTNCQTYSPVVANRVVPSQIGSLLELRFIRH